MANYHYLDPVALIPNLHAFVTRNTQAVPSVSLFPVIDNPVVDFVFHFPHRNFFRSVGINNKIK